MCLQGFSAVLWLKILLSGLVYWTSLWQVAGLLGYLWPQVLSLKSMDPYHYQAVTQTVTSCVINPKLSYRLTETFGFQLMINWCSNAREMQFTWLCTLRLDLVMLLNNKWSECLISVKRASCLPRRLAYSAAVCYLVVSYSCNRVHSPKDRHCDFDTEFRKQHGGDF